MHALSTQTQIESKFRTENENRRACLKRKGITIKKDVKERLE